MAVIEQSGAHGLPARKLALAALGQVLRSRRPLDAGFDELMAKQHLAPRDLGFARAIVTEALRRFGQLDALIRTFVRKTPPPHRAGPTLEILLAGACELAFLDVAPHAAVDAANRLAASDSRAVHFKPLINAILRRIAAEGKSVVSAQDAERLNTPDWLWSRWCEVYGEETTRAIARVHGETPPLDITLGSAGDVTLFGPGAEIVGDRTVRIRDAGPIEALPGFPEGRWWVQDFAASLPVHIMGDVRGKTVVDLCAAPGGKTAQLAAAGANVIAVEREPSRLARVKENLGRLKLSAELIEADVRDFAPTTRLDLVLLDAPCSATGTIRRHPELSWIKGAADVNTCAQNAGELLEAAADMVAPGGMLVFAVCSLEPEECDAQIEHFLRRRGDFRRRPLQANEVFGMTQVVTSAGDLRTLPCHIEGGMDGFYAARLLRSG